jgi:CcmD family protein
MKRLRAWALASLLGGALFASTTLSLATVAAAQDGSGQEDAAESRAATFEAARGAQTEDVPGGALLIAAYGVIWLLLFGFIGSIAARQARTQRELARLRQDIQAHARNAPSGALPPEEF